MQTPKARTNSSGGPQRTSPRATSTEATQKNSSPQAELPQKSSPRVVRQLKSTPRYSDHTTSSSNLATRTPKDGSPKDLNSKSLRSPISENKQHPGKVSDLETQISKLENDLKTVKDQLCSTEVSKKQARKDVEESNQKLLELSSKLEESQKQLLEQSASEEVHKLVLQEALAGRDEEFQSQLKAIQKQHSNDLSLLASALNEIEKLKTELENLSESEATLTKNSESVESDLCVVKENLAETLLLVEDMKNQLRECKESETHAQELVGETLTQLVTAKKMVETLRSDGLKNAEAYDAIASELEESRARVKHLEELVSKLEADLSSKNSHNEESKAEESTETELISMKVEVEQLKSALEASETRYSEEQVRNTEQLRKTFEMVEQIKSTSSQREAGFELELRKSRYEIEELKANLMDKETELQGICEENEGLAIKLKSTVSGQRENELEQELNKSKADMESLKSLLTSEEMEWRKLSEENEKLKLEIKKTSNGKLSDEIVSDIDAAGMAEKEALMKIGYMSEEIDKSNRKAARVAEQLEAAQAVNAEMETELRRLKVQSDQWRKAAEAAAAMLSTGHNGQIKERTGSMDSHYSPRMGKLGSPYADDLDEEFLKKKNANMITRLWKKQQK
ncbi:interactor of constitutive active ROPs 3 [Dorcoceras hygrometricum]|uniref:Interactor of constitutive active ROPs 3 n=1 Tax=Dorcoceras hygrometricum TaxID=472368 RepID=A0A2Z7CP26_9LAMI|nr:interactor of constitutive active ROPs 3 [Dorcoceras hygrometricum]